ncbi:MAG: hypothetical protein AB2L09_00560 [Coriobacteriia bacterium]
MLLTEERRSRISYLEALTGGAQEKGIPPVIVEEACRATAKMVHRAGFDPESARGMRRASAYFDAVVRRNVLRRGASRETAAPYLIAADLADLKATGRDAERAWEELRRGWSHRVPEEVLEPFRARLCG